MSVVDADVIGESGAERFGRAARAHAYVEDGAFGVPRPQALQDRALRRKEADLARHRRVLLDDLARLVHTLVISANASRDRGHG
jgi:hypothetical protein